MKRGMIATVVLVALTLTPVAAEDYRLSSLPIPIFERWGDVVPTLIGGLASDDALTRERCAFILGKIGDDSSTPALLKALDEPVRAVRMMAGIALANMGEEVGVPAARAATLGTRGWMRYYAVVALARTGGDRAMTAVERLVDDVDPLVSEMALRALAGDMPQATPAQLTEADTTWTVDECIYEAAGLYVAEADQWYHNGDYRQCVRSNEAGLLLDPLWTELYANSGYLLWSLGRPAEALGAYSRGAQAVPDDWRTHFDLGYHYVLIHRYESAAAALGKARELGCPPTQAHTHAHALEKAGRLPEALQAWREIAETEPDSPLPPHHIGRLTALLQTDG